MHRETERIHPFERKYELNPTLSKVEDGVGGGDSVASLESNGHTISATFFKFLQK